MNTLFCMLQICDWTKFCLTVVIDQIRFPKMALYDNYIFVTYLPNPLRRNPSLHPNIFFIFWFVATLKDQSKPVCLYSVLFYSSTTISNYMSENLQV